MIKVIQLVFEAALYGFTNAFAEEGGRYVFKKLSHKRRLTRKRKTK